MKNKKIIWIASYPKSGNTFLRFLIASLLHSKKGDFEFDIIKNIRQFDIDKYYKFIQKKNLKDYENLNSIKTISKYWKEAQKRSYGVENKNIFKTHAANLMFNNHKYTDEDRSLGLIYIIRDPRDIAISYSHHTGKNLDDIIKILMNQNAVLSNSKGKIKVPLSRWDIHVKSWSMLNIPKYFIRYEDLIQNTEKYFIEIANFLNKDLEINFELNEKKIKNIIKNTSFKNLKNKEAKHGFDESSKKNFFREGKSNQWKNILNIDQQKKIKNTFTETMNRFDYN